MKPEITLIIFSKNRAMQLDALLRSIKERLPIFKNICVIYQTKKMDYHYSSYNQVFSDHTDVKPCFQGPRNLSTEVEEFIEQYNSTPYVCFMTDDDIIFRKVSFRSQSIMSAQIDKIGDRYSGYSLRLHKGIKNRVHFDYKFSVDGTIYLRATILNIVKKLHTESIQNPNHMETAIQGNYGHRFTLPLAYNPLQSCLIGVPVNRVSDTSHCWYGEKHPMTPDQLLQMYLEGYRIDIDRLTFSQLNDVHEETELKFYKL